MGQSSTESKRDNWCRRKIRQTSKYLRRPDECRQESGTGVCLWKVTGDSESMRSPLAPAPELLSFAARILPSA